MLQSLCSGIVGTADVWPALLRLSRCLNLLGGSDAARSRRGLSLPSVEAFAGSCVVLRGPGPAYLCLLDTGLSWMTLMGVPMSVSPPLLPLLLSLRLSWSWCLVLGRLLCPDMLNSSSAGKFVLMGLKVAELPGKPPNDVLG